MRAHNGDHKFFIVPISKMSTEANPGEIPNGKLLTLHGDRVFHAGSYKFLDFYFLFF